VRDHHICDVTQLSQSQIPNLLACLNGAFLRPASDESYLSFILEKNIHEILEAANQYSQMSSRAVYNLLAVVRRTSRAPLLYTASRGISTASRLRLKESSGGKYLTAANDSDHFRNADD